MYTKYYNKFDLNSIITIMVIDTQFYTQCTQTEHYFRAIEIGNKLTLTCTTIKIM